MFIQLKIDPTQTLATLKELGQERQGPFILARGLNLIAKKVQKALRDNMAANLTLKRTVWVKNQVMIRTGNWATKTRLIVRIDLSDTGAFLAGFEGGADHLPGMGRKFLAIPNKAVFGSKPIQQNNILKLSNLNLRSTPFGLEGNQRTFVIHAKGTNVPLVMQEISQNTKRGMGAKGVNRYLGNRILYTMVHHSTRPARLAWYQTAGQVVALEQASTLAEVMRAALNDAKKK